MPVSQSKVVQAQIDLPDRASLSGRDGLDRQIDVLLRMQRGLVYPAPQARFALLWLTSADALSLSGLSSAMRAVYAAIDAQGMSNTSNVVVGTSFALFSHWCAVADKPVPKAMQYRYPDVAAPGKLPSSRVFARSNGVFQDSQADLFVHVKADTKADLATLYDLLRKELGAAVARDNFTDCDSRTRRGDRDTGRVLGCRFAENLNNPADPVSVAEHTLVGNDDRAHAGGSVVLAQRFAINWGQLHALPAEGVEDMIGRTTDDVILPTRSERSHIKCGRFRDARGCTRAVMRLGLPFGTSDFDEADDELRGANVRDEEGIFFAGFTNSVQTLEGIMDRQIGDVDGFMQDKLFHNVRSSLGGFFYIPSMVDLGLGPHSWKNLESFDWKSFPGVDWSRLSRHFTEKSDNGLMYYNHKNYLYEMSTMSAKRATATLKPPTARIQNLLLDMFTVWQDTWYFPKKQEDMGKLEDYLKKFFPKEDAAAIMASSVMVRKGWATRVTCLLYSSDDYGFRGIRDVDGVQTHGADTFRILPQDLIAGAMTDLTLGQGRTTVKYIRDDEQADFFFRGLSEASGVGHVVPDLQKLVTRGLPGMIADVDAKHAAASADKKDFYHACRNSLLGVQDLLLRYADLADRMFNEFSPDLRLERENMTAMAARLRNIATGGPPGTMLEAAQLIFTMFVCLQYNGEAIALGRLDQYLYPLYSADIQAGRMTEEEAQEIIDAFWIKIDEKVLQNRLFMQDHQPPGNLAMGGVSGPYPQGASLNQWVQQITVGGLVADDAASSTPAYNDVTKLCIRAAARLPLNAPCLSLRVSKSTPQDFLEEAATAILSGGAHPVLLNDDKIVPGLVASGAGIGQGGDNSNAYTPVREKTGGKFDSTVSLRDARNYAADGCYEPMFVGQNWFTLGGFSALNPLECALNRGRLYASAGEAFIKGQNHSFRSRAADEIESFDDLIKLYFEHFYMLWARAFNGSMATFDAVAAVCPSPLLSTFMDDCLEKGLDIYCGGAKYNVFGPCFSALSTTINSLYNINKMVFDPDTACTSMAELTVCLMCDWGEKMVEPFYSSMIGSTRIEAKAERYRRLRKVALSYEKYGRGAPVSPDYKEGDLGTYNVDQLGDYIINRICELTVKALTDPFSSTAAQMTKYAEKYGTPELPFGVQILPGCGTFENFVAFGGSSGASADGRRNGEWIASDMSPSPSAQNETPNPQLAPLSRALKGYTGDGSSAMWEGAPVDFNIEEDFPKEDLVNVLKEFAAGEGSNILTITCADHKVMQEAMSRPEKYDLLRVRMGGWSEFFTSMFPASQKQHVCRPISVAECPMKKSG